LGSIDEEDVVDQATPPTDAGEDQGPEPDTDTMISGGNYVDHMSGTADDDLVYLDAGDDFYDGKQGDADAGDDTIHGETEMTLSEIVEGPIFCMAKRDGTS
jgi:hypothetical protein